MLAVPTSYPPRLHVGRSILAGAAVFAMLFLLCSATQAIADIPASRLFLGLFAAKSLSEPRAEVMALGWALLCGGLLGLLVSTFANVFGAIDRPRQ